MEAADITAAGTTADITAVRFGGRSGGHTMGRRSTMVPMLRTTGILIMDIHTMRIHHRPSTHTPLRQHLQPSVTLQWLTKMEG